MKVIKGAVIFEWDKGNIDKNLLAHGVRNEECEEVFFDQEKRVLRDALHSRQEKRYIIIGKTKKSRLLFIIFMIRKDKIRVISARDLNKKEEPLYYEKKA